LGEAIISAAIKEKTSFLRQGLGKRAHAKYAPETTDGYRKTRREKGNPHEFWREGGGGWNTEKAATFPVFQDQRKRCCRGKKKKEMVIAEKKRDSAGEK